MKFTFTSISNSMLAYPIRMLDARHFWNVINFFYYGTPCLRPSYSSAGSRCAAECAAVMLVFFYLFRVLLPPIFSRGYFGSVREPCPTKVLMRNSLRNVPHEIFRGVLADKNCSMTAFPWESHRIFQKKLNSHLHTPRPLTSAATYSRSTELLAERARARANDMSRGKVVPSV